MTAAFHPLIEQWFAERHGAPTEIQALAWPRIAGRESLLITAPTGSGKTLTAFLWAINRFVTGDCPTGSTRVLYVSPLKALNNDIQRNLMTPLSELQTMFEAAGEQFPDIRVSTRSGDTGAGDRRRMLRHPPEILITTPESLNLLLSSKNGLSVLGDLETVILDEIHGVVNSKRGVYLMSAVERLVALSGEFQRIALSATVNPLDTVARYVGGFSLDGDRFMEREVASVASATTKTYEIVVRRPESRDGSDDDEVWRGLAEDMLERINRNRSTLIFANSRALCEKLTFQINAAAGATVAWAHHGSLSREIRFEVEQKMKAGNLAAIVATSTLEMGIDIGELDEVILVQSPDAVSSAIQRIGRAGHGVGEISRCTIYPTHPMDFVEAAVLGKAVRDRDLEPVRTVECPLDVLAQVIVSMTGTRTWDLDELFLAVRLPTAFHALTRTQFDLVIDMLAGRYAEHHVRELRPRVNVDRLDNTISARPGALLSLYLSGGVIPDRGYFTLRHEDGNAKIGELDEEFVWEANVGQVFSLGTQHWQVRKITHNDVIVAPAKPGGMAPPFWKAEPLNRDFHYASRVGEFLEWADGRVEDDAFVDDLMTGYCMEREAADELRDFLVRQKDHCHAALPHRHHLLVERVRMAPGGTRGEQAVFHTGWGARVNRPLAMAIEAGWYETRGEQPEIYVSNECIVIQLQPDMATEDVLALARPRDLEQRLRQRLEGSGFFGARFRENAGRALLLSKGRFNERKPLWMSRLQSKKLLDAVMKYDDFPLLLETWRTCLRDEFDLDSLEKVLDAIDSGDIEVTEVRSESPGPFAHGVAWGQINTYMYMDDSPTASKVSRLNAGLLEELVFSPGIRPAIPAGVVRDFEARRQRRLAGYEPTSDDEWVEWVKERTVIPAAEWDTPVAELPDRLVATRIGDARLIVAREDEPSVVRAFTSSDTEAAAVHLANWLQYYGPVSMERIVERLGIDTKLLVQTLDTLVEERTLIHGQLIADDDCTTWCDAENFEILLRLLRQQSRASFEAMPLAALTSFLHHWQTRFQHRDPIEQLFETIERLRGHALPAALWEREVLPSRLPAYAPASLDALIQEGNLLWLGTGDKQIAFCFADDLDLVRDDRPSADPTLDAILPDTGGRYDFGTLLDRSGTTAHALNDALWQSVWQGEITNDTVAALRKGIEHEFSVPEATATAPRSGRRTRRGGFGEWRNAVPFAGNWYRIHYPPPPEDLLSTEELCKDRVRLVLERYGIVFRELLQRELPALQWRGLFRSIRLMELSGELLSGYFFDGITGLQFVSPAAFRVMQRGLPEAVFWINAADPISPCGLGLETGLPRRIPSNHLVYHGETLVLVSERAGKSLSINVDAAHERLPAYLDVLHHLLYRGFDPMRKLVIETINDEPAGQSPYFDVLASRFRIHRDYKSINVEREL